MLVLSPKSAKRLTEKISSALASGLQCHQAGRLPETECCSRKILSLNPDPPSGLHFLGVLAQQTGQCAVAIELNRVTIQLNPQCADYHNNLGNTDRLQNQPLADILTAIAPHSTSQHLYALHAPVPLLMIGAGLSASFRSHPSPLTPTGNISSFGSSCSA